MVALGCKSNNLSLLSVASSKSVKALIPATVFRLVPTYEPLVGRLTYSSVYFLGKLSDMAVNGNKVRTEFLGCGGEVYSIHNIRFQIRGRGGLRMSFTLQKYLAT